MFGHQTMFDSVMSPNISCLDGPLGSLDLTVRCENFVISYKYSAPCYDEPRYNEDPIITNNI